MLNNYLKIALRNLLKNKVDSFVSIFGLALGLAATTVILIVNYSELTWDKSWVEGDRIFELQQVFTSRSTPTKLDTVSTLRQMKMIEERFKDIEYVGNIATADGEIKIKTEQQQQDSFRKNITYITPNILDIFSLTAIKGDTKEFYANKQSVILSANIAAKLFAETDPIGKTVEIKSNSYVPTENNIPLNTTYKVIAIISNTQKRTSLRSPMDIIVSSSYPIQHDDANSFYMKEFSATYVKLKVGANVQHINSQLPTYLDKDVPSMGGSESKKNSAAFSFTLVNIKDIHLKGFNSETQVQRMAILYSLAGIIFVLAAINYINLATARFSRRQREIALRKTMGAEQRSILSQFLVESLLSAFCALMITLIILEPLLPWLNTTLNINIETQYLADLRLLALILGVAFSMGLITGFYPGLILSRIRPAVVLKSNKSHETSKSIKFRKLLVIFQFILSSAMLVSVGIIATQLYAALNANLGYDTQNIVYLIDEKFVANKDSLNINRINSLKQKIQAIPGVLAATKTMPMLPGAMGELKTTYSSKQKPEEAAPIPLTFVEDADELELFNISLIAGKNFAPKIEDGNKPTVIINEQALKTFSFSSAEEAIGKTLNINLFSSETTLATIVGVTSKLQLGDINKPSGPLILMRFPEGWSFEAGTLGVRFGENVNKRVLITQIKDICKSFNGTTLQGEVWLQSLVEEQYKSQILIAKFVYTFAALAMLISCLGLYGLASFAAEKRTKEIGLRKVHGASISDIVRLLLWQFTKPIALANLIAWPIALYVMNRWLENFNQRIDLWVWGPIYCLLAGVLAIAIAWLTVGGQAYLVARAKPVAALREE
jgi:putative ABC transport system permease protein